MNKLTEIADILKQSNTIFLFPHVQMDGDALGSAVALCQGLRRLEKSAYILIDEPIPANLKFLDRGFCTTDPNLFGEPDVCMAIDCSDLSRIETRKDVFLRGKTTISVDHHITSVPFCTMHYMDASAAATGEIIFKLLKVLNVPLDTTMGEALFSALATDTGNFMYSNATKETHEIVASLYDTGMNHNQVAVEIYQKIRREKVHLITRVLSNMEFFSGGRGVISFVSQDILKETGANMDESEGIVEQLRNIDGVEISIILKEDNGKVKVGMRSKTYADVAAISTSFGGGGHTKAAGFTLNASVIEAKATLISTVSAYLDQIQRD